METSNLKTFISDSLKNVTELQGCEVFGIHVIVARFDGTIVARHSDKRSWEHPHDEIAMLKLAHKLHGCVPQDRVEFFRKQLEVTQAPRDWGVASTSDLVVTCSSTPQWFAKVAAESLAQRLAAPI